MAVGVGLCVASSAHASKVGLLPDLCDLAARETKDKVTGLGQQAFSRATSRQDEEAITGSHCRPGS